MRTEKSQKGKKGHKLFFYSFDLMGQINGGAGQRIIDKVIKEIHSRILMAADFFELSC